ncbi:MAG: hypothetical protein HOZ81_38685 [Streptomyces sp.]|nr:hypothetical protein [Streptomyces sp.]NUT31322.1 hypothetical protein [Streptomyces sp.]
MDSPHVPPVPPLPPDVAQGGMVVAVGSAMFFVQPAPWGKYEQERAQAEPRRRALAEQAGISRLLELK